MLTKLIDVTNNYKEQCNILIMMKDEKGIKEVFSNRVDRLVNSIKSYIVKKGSKEIGFVNLVIEKSDPDFYFLDIGLKEEYRNKGVGTEILERLQEMDFNKFIILEVKKSNEGANNTINKVGVKVAETLDVNFYLFQRDRLQEFIDNDYMEKLGNHIRIKSKKDLIYRS